MKLVVGLGNPGAEYALTRHNAGFFVADALQTAFNLPGWVKKCKGLVSKGRMAGEDVILLKPQTYMNLSGESVREAADFYKVGLGDLLVIHDDIDLPMGELRWKIGGSDAGHNGLKSITSHFGADYARLRFGVGRPIHKGAVADYVLGNFSASDEVLLAEQAGWIVEHIGDILLGKTKKKDAPSID